MECCAAVAADQRYWLAGAGNEDPLLPSLEEIDLEDEAVDVEGAMDDLESALDSAESSGPKWHKTTYGHGRYGNETVKVLIAKYPQPIRNGKNKGSVCLTANCSLAIHFLVQLQ